MAFILRRLSLGLGLIAASSALLLFSDSGGRRGGSGPQAKVAILQFASSPLMEEGVAGMREGLREGGFPDRSLDLDLFNAEGDMPTANAIASEITAGQYDLILTSGTPAMQAVANANRQGKTTHVFGLVADPFGAGVGINRENPLDHPAHLVGIGSFIPVEPAFRLARRLFPGLKVVGEVWNPAESNSEAFTVEARRVCEEMGIELLEANADNSAGVFEAASSLVARGAEALWIGGDNTVAVAAASMMTAAKPARIPVFSILTGNAQRGALFESGADFVGIGKETGLLAARILGGADPSKIPVVNSVPEKLVVNTTALEGLRDPWSVPEDVLERAHTVIDASGSHPRASADSKGGTDHPPLSRTWEIALFNFVESPASEEAEQGVLDGFSEAGLVEGRDYRVTSLSAQGDFATVNSIVSAAVTRGADLVFPVSTPALQAALAQAGGLPIIFSLVANPMLAGAGSTYDEHLPNVAGVYVVSPFQEMMQMLRESFPEIRRIGTLFAPAEVNSVYYKDLMQEAADAAGLELELIGVSNSSEVSDAALSLCSRGIDAVCQISDNLSSSTFVSIAEAANRFKLPVFTFNTTQADQGASVVLARDYYDGGKSSGLLAARVMRGESPGSIPFEPIRATKLVLNLKAARVSGLHIPSSLLDKADRVIQP